jgi:galactose mutarotase-like enzyme
MIHTIENPKIKVSVKEIGAELSSFFDKENSIEYLWQGNPDIWSGQAPILFPIIGRLLNDKYTLNGKEYSMPKHGLVRKKAFSLIEKKNDEMTFLITADDNTRAAYPFEFELYVNYKLIDRKLEVKHTVKNINNITMYFSIGAHPAFNCEIGDYLEFDENETLISEKIDLIDSIRIDDTYPVLNNEKKIVITKDIFNEDALILSGIKSDYITLKSNNHNRFVRFYLGKPKYLGIWAKPGAPYVCIEPWDGVNDSYHKKSDFSQKDAILRLEPQKAYEFIWTAEI